MADLNGCNWIKGNGPGEVDMRQRAKALQEQLFEVTVNEPGDFDNGRLVYLKAELDDDRYHTGTKVREAQIGFITGQRTPNVAFGEEHWVWVTWYAGPLAAEAAQCHRTEELGVVKTHAPFME